MKKAKWSFMLLFVVLLLAACSSDTEETSAENDSEIEVEGRENELVVGVPGDPQNWDPIDTFLLDWSTVATSVFEGLVDRNLDLELQPGLAESWEYVDDQTLQFKLREGVTFHNGEPFNADAVKFTFDRLLGEEGAQGPQQANYTSIDNVEVVDEYTVNFNLNEKDPVLLTKLAGYGAVIVPPKYIEENGDEHFNTNPVGTGPFKMTSYEQDSKAVLEKNEDYWKDGVPKLNKVTFRFIPEASTRLAELQTGEIDVMKRVEISQVESLKDHPSLSIQEVGTPTVYSLRFNTEKEPFDDKRVRQAVNYAIDKDAIIEEILGGYGEKISTFQSELSFGNNPDLKPYPYDPEKAKQLLEEAGVAEGTEVDIYIPGNDGNFKEITQVVSYYLEEVGLKANIESVDSNTLISDLIPSGEAGHMYRQGWGGWTLDFDNTAYLMYHEGEHWNPSFYDEEVEELLEAERTTVDQEKREEIFMKLTERLHELAPEANLYSEVALYAVHDRVKNFQPPHEDRMRLEEVTVE
ncbi:ABC transporter substrate-binding protein [Halobacillus aidingensis]|uniref:Peptide/nickel transport system substrate-binding protein n=1 Tax=Halobacillus aidingensis TaxID=240303 RepID=A0A1H0H0X9_HALAD|nr:ABC transporter substrate-binding protein [Halobacillus aidingensis]SDO12765.1 peptide/nickel transport system substrate-binding protein [Halobacillus aidingensis]